MKSFRLDYESVTDAIESWPAILASVALSVGFGYLGWFNAAWRIFLVVFAGAYFGYVFRGELLKNIRARYPKASCIGLLSIGFCVITTGVAARMVFPKLQNGPVDLVWLSISFASILTFVIINRHDPDVWH